ncbi:MAG: phage holin family protein [Clostridia bacterium]|nr:phage holin family protein [Clostridia bacterium]MBR2327415.1 phage holin family protein [Clostridia bacterium]
MNTVTFALKGAFAAVFTFITYLFGGFDIPVITLLVFIILDYITGVISAVFTKTLSSSYGLLGILKKIAILCCVVVAVMLDRLLETDFIFKTAFCYFMIANEGISVLENAGKMGIPLPQKLLDALKQLKE